jgi:hypothetical protein
VVTLNYPFQDQLANFDIYYKAPNSTSYVQLKKQLTNSAKLDTAFCFYKLVDDNTLQITFSGDDSYFQPEYNSEIIVEMSTPEEVDMFNGFGVYKYVNCPQCHTNCTISCDFTEKTGFFKRIFCKK